MKLLTIAVLAMLLAGCGQSDNTKSILKLKPTITNGTTLLIFPEWETSDSAFERKVYTNYYAVYNSGKWFVREQQNDGSLATFWKSDTPYRSLDDVKMGFGLNIKWNIYRGIYDAFTVTNTTEKTISSTGSVRTNMPPGFALQVDKQNKYRPCRNGGPLFTYEAGTTKQEAMQAAWGQYEYEHRDDKTGWEDVK